MLTARMLTVSVRAEALAIADDAEAGDLGFPVGAALVLAAPALLLRDCVYRRGAGARLGLLDHLPDVLVVWNGVVARGPRVAGDGVAGGDGEERGRGQGAFGVDLG